MEDAQSKIDQEISSLRSKFSKQVSELKTRRNELSHIGSLQFEVLAEVFWIITHSGSTNFSPAPMAEIVKFGTVCRKWHAVIQNNPRLWSQIDTSSDRRMHKMLEMSKRALLQLRVDVDSQREGRVRTAFSSLTRNFNLVHMRCSLHSLTNICRSLSPECLAPLESLSLAKHWGSQGSESNLLPPALRDCVASRLSSLRLDGFILPYDAPLLSAGALARLEVTLPVNSPAAERGSIDQLVGLLAILPKLQYLTLKALPPITPSPYFPSRISLPNLVGLVLHGTVQECAQLLDLLEIGTGLKIEIRAVYNAIKDIDILIPAFIKTCTYPHLDYMSLTLSSGVNIIGKGTVPNSPNFNLCLKAASNSYGWMGSADMTMPIFSTFLVELQVLTVVGSSGSLNTWQRWADMFGIATKLKTLIVEHLELKHVISALRVPKSAQSAITTIDNAGMQPATRVKAARRGGAVGRGVATKQRTVESDVRPAQGEPASVLWKNLKHITFSGMELSYSTQLISTLNQRADAGFPIESIRIQECYISEVTVGELKCIAKVDWDRLERGKRDEDDEDDEDDEYDFGHFSYYRQLGYRQY